jgi:hemin uptake protein HemP
MHASLTAHAFFPPAGQAAHGGATQHGGTLPASAVDSHTLLQGQKAVTIVHNGALYRLQATKLGKLILTK